MVYISKDGSVKEENVLQKFFAKLWTILAAILFFFQSLVGLDQSGGYRNANDHRDHLRRSNTAGGGRYDGAALDGRGGRGNGGGAGVNRRIGGMASSSGIAPPPMGGGCCGGGGCG
ncbi:hypothetical protein PRIPAC_82944 [Pristionchus pacificus]|uniref:Uncharacterized protein n=1 Tax=Pristionchus pacificus TaxID=54126 RepID=A0A8R1Z930_PRIPA|nr:hypothetical protein PRIPAC_82944 [Pristionchus pacificus]